MEVSKKTSALVLSALVFTACEKNKSTETVFSKAADECIGNVVPHKYIVNWEDGRRTIETATDDEDFKERFVRPRLHEIRMAENDFSVKVKPTKVSASSGAPVNWGAQQIEADVAWKNGALGSTSSGNPILVAVVDAGVDYTHPLLASQMAYNMAEYGPDKNGTPNNTMGSMMITMGTLMTTPEFLSLMEFKARFNPANMELTSPASSQPPMRIPR